MKNNLVFKLAMLLLSFTLMQYTANAQRVSNDDDNDGVPNSEDLCPMVAGTKANKGCPEEQKATTTYSSYAESQLDNRGAAESNFCKEYKNALTKFQSEYRGTIAKETRTSDDGKQRFFNKPLFTELPVNNNFIPKSWKIEASSKYYNDKQEALKLYNKIKQEIISCTNSSPTSEIGEISFFSASDDIIDASGHTKTPSLSLSLIEEETNKFIILFYIEPE